MKRKQSPVNVNDPRGNEFALTSELSLGRSMSRRLLQEELVGTRSPSEEKKKNLVKSTIRTFMTTETTRNIKFAKSRTE